MLEDKLLLLPIAVGHRLIIPGLKPQFSTPAFGASLFEFANYENRGARDIRLFAGAVRFRTKRFPGD